jgi:hypothetical protein
MDWEPVYTPDSMETVTISGYECTACGYITMYTYDYCPHCGREWCPEPKENDK